MKRVNLVNLKIDTNMDADDYGHRLVECFEKCSDCSSVVNMIKVKLSDNVKAYDISKLITPIRDSLKEMGATNCIFIPLVKGHIEDVSVDYVEVKHNESNN